MFVVNIFLLEKQIILCTVNICWFGPTLTLTWITIYIYSLNGIAYIKNCLPMEWMEDTRWRDVLSLVHIFFVNVNVFSLWMYTRETNILHYTNKFITLDALCIQTVWIGVIDDLCMCMRKCIQFISKLTTFAIIYHHFISIDSID